MGIMEGLRDCECRTAGKIGGGRCEAKKVEREGIGTGLLGRRGMEGEGVREVKLGR